MRGTYFRESRRAQAMGPRWERVDASNVWDEGRIRDAGAYLRHRLGPNLNMRGACSANRASRLFHPKTWPATTRAFNWRHSLRFRQSDNGFELQCRSTT